MPIIHDKNICFIIQNVMHIIHQKLCLNSSKVCKRNNNSKLTGKILSKAYIYFFKHDLYSLRQAVKSMYF